MPRGRTEDALDAPRALRMDRWGPPRAQGRIYTETLDRNSLNPEALNIETLDRHKPLNASESVLAMQLLKSRLRILWFAQPEAQSKLALPSESVFRT